jgi:hypothetical protein
MIRNIITLVCGAALGCFAWFGVGIGGNLPKGTPLTDEEASQVVGGQAVCGRMVKTCELVNNNCAVGQCYVRPAFFTGSQPGPSAGATCIDGTDPTATTYCCASTVVACAGT